MRAEEAKRKKGVERERLLFSNLGGVFFSPPSSLREVNLAQTVTSPGETRTGHHGNGLRGRRTAAGGITQHFAPLHAPVQMVTITNAAGGRRAHSSGVHAESCWLTAVGGGGGRGSPTAMAAA